jgi:hypothetical protein
LQEVRVSPPRNLRWLGIRGDPMVAAISIVDPATSRAVNRRKSCKVSTVID